MADRTMQFEASAGKTPISEAPISEEKSILVSLGGSYHD